MAEGSKTEKATPKKRRDERKKGNVFLSKDAIIVATLLAGFLALMATANSSVAELQHFFSYCFDFMRFSEIGQVQGQLTELTVRAIMVCLKTMGPILAATVIAGVAATFAQTKLLVSGESIRPKFSRINPLEGVKRLFSLRSIIETLKGTLKIIILLFIIYNYISGLLGSFSDYMNTDIALTCSQIFSETVSMVIQIVVAFTALAAFDFFYQWWDYERQLKMTKQEIKEEYKQMEGDPQIKGKIKEMQRKMAQSRMMQQVPQADVVIRNPTHFAVALRYKPDVDVAPIVLAKGMDELALRIVRVAEENQVTVVENVPLARALYADAELGLEIPPAMYGAVAEVLAYLYRINADQNKPQ